MENKSFKYYGSALPAMFFRSFSFAWFKVAYKAYEPMTVVLFRLSLSAALTFFVAKMIGNVGNSRCYFRIVYGTSKKKKT